MKKISTFALASLCMFGVVSCGSSNSDNDSTSNSGLQKGTEKELQTAIADRDSLFVLINEINGNITEIKAMEDIVTTTPMNGDLIDKRQELRNSIQALQNELEQRRLRLNDLEKRLSASSGQNKILLATISELKKQIEDQNAVIAQLRADLGMAQQQIEELNTTVSDLNTTVESVTSERDMAREETRAVTEELNTCYYVVGSKKELKDHKIIEGGSLFKKSKLNINDFEASYFTRADKTTLVRLPLNSKKFEIRTNHPNDSYTIETGEGGLKTLVITNPNAFWNQTNYLVVETK